MEITTKLVLYSAIFPLKKITSDYYVSHLIVHKEGVTVPLSTIVIELWIKFRSILL